MFALVPAGGIGQRAIAPASQTAVPKQYRLIHGVSMLAWSVQALLAEPRISRVIVGVQTNDRQALDAVGMMDRVIIQKTAGDSRARTVLQSLETAMREQTLSPGDWVLVHDAARPGLPLEALRNLVDACLEHETGGLLAMPVTDTVKLAVEADDSVESGVMPARVYKTVARERVWLAQTPQMFRAGALAQALAGALAAGHEVTDEASAMEWAGAQPLLVAGSAANFKITWPEDFERAERLLG